MQMALKKDCGLSIKDTNLTDIAAADAIGVFADPNVAAVGTYEPVLSQVVAAHADRGAHIVASSKDYDDLILDIIMVHTDELEANPEKYVKFLRAIYRAVDYFNANQEEAIPIIAAQFSITPDDFKATMPNFRYTPFDEAVELIGTTDKEGRVYEVFREAMDLNLEFGSSDVKLLPGGSHRPLGDQPGPLRTGSGGVHAVPSAAANGRRRMDAPDAPVHGRALRGRAGAISSRSAPGPITDVELWSGSAHSASCFWLGWR